MISKNQQKLIRALRQKKQREKHGMYVIEGDKIITDLLRRDELNPQNLVMLCATEDWYMKQIETENSHTPSIITVSKNEINQLTTLMTPPDVLAVVKIPADKNSHGRMTDPDNEYTLVFDAIRDPGNLGTIIRTADWFGFRNIICSLDSVDAYNNKVVQSSMGAIIRLQPEYADLEELLEQTSRKKVPVYGTTMDGDDLFDTPVKKNGMIIFGNESAGINPELEGFFRAKIRIPDHPSSGSGTESLNVASSVAIVCAELRRRMR